MATALPRIGAAFGEGGEAFIFAGDPGEKETCDKLVQQTVDRVGQLDVLVNNAGEQHPDKKVEDITSDQLQRTFQPNIFSMFYLVQAARPLSENLVGDGFRVTAVAPGPIWTPLNPSGGASPEKLEHFGEETPMGRPGEPNEVTPAFLFLACEDSSCMSGQVLHPNGGIVVNGQTRRERIDADGFGQRDCRQGLNVPGKCVSNVDEPARLG